MQPWYSLPDQFRSVAARSPGAVLLETAKFDSDNYHSYLFVDPLYEVTASDSQPTAAVCAQIDTYVAQGYYLAGFFSYEFGERLCGMAPRGTKPAVAIPLLKLGVFREPIRFDHRDGTISGPFETCLEADPAGEDDAAQMGLATLSIGESDYVARILAVQAYLAAGHSYQVNFTDQVHGSFSGSPLALYRLLLERQPVAFAAFLNLGDRQVLSFSPELFYRIQDGRISAKPMKCTWARGRNGAEDLEAAESLRSDEKNRAEHVTIVDLLRNDLGRICTPGSVQVDRLMEVERFRTLHQMTSTISGNPGREHTPSQIFKALFPCGSITGAPKRRTMGIIRELERSPRGVYTGAIGFFAPLGDACFSVAIRTAVLEGTSVSLGVGGGITLDSTPKAEFRECKLKASFLQEEKAPFYLFETMRASDGDIRYLQAHLRRLQDSAAYFARPFDKDAICRAIASCLVGTKGEWRVRLTLDAGGNPNCEVSELHQLAWSGRVLLSDSTTDSADRFLQHKTTNRRFYDEALREARSAGFDEVLFRNESGHLTEGAISTLLVRIRGSYVTPPVGDGLLPGVLRSEVLSRHADVEVRSIALTELLHTDAIWLINSLRGVLEVTALYESRGAELWRLRSQVGDVPGQAIP